MRLLFVDDSGSPTTRRSLGDSGLYILAGVAVDDKNLASVAEAACRAKAAIGARMGLGEWEAHGYYIWNDAGQFRGDKAILGIGQKREVFSAMVDVIASSQLDIIPVVVDRHDSRGSGGRRGPLAVAWTAMFRRFGRLLDAQGGECGLILADEGRREDKNTARAIVERAGQARKDCDPACGVLNGVIFRDSRRDVMIQLADMIAYVVHRHRRNDVRFCGWFESLRPKFDMCPADPCAQRAGDGCT